MNPKTVNKLMSEVPEMKELLSFIRKEVCQLDSTSDIKLNDPIELSVEVKSRQRAIEVLTNILTPLLNTQEANVVKNNEYVV